MDWKWFWIALAALWGVTWWIGGGAPPAAEETILFAQGGAHTVALWTAPSGALDAVDAGPIIHGVGVLPDGSKAYASSLGSNDVAVIDLNQKARVASVDVGGTSHHIAVSPDGRWAYVTLGSAAAVAVIDTETDTLRATIPVGEGPTYAAFAPDGRMAYVTSKAANLVSVIDTDALRVVNEITVDGPDHLALSADGKSLYVTSGGAGELVVIDVTKDAVVAAVPVGNGPHGVAVVERRGSPLVFVGNRGDTTLSAIDAATLRVVGTVELHASPEHLTASADRKRLYVGSVPASRLLVFDVERNRVSRRVVLPGEIHQISLVGRAPVARFAVVAAPGGVYRNLTAAQLHGAPSQDQLTLVNVHVPYAGELPNTDAFIPYDKIEQASRTLSQDKGATLVVYCRSGAMSAAAAATLVELGYTNVWNLEGGMRAWEEAGYSLIHKPEPN